jgi:hypothetical protein
MSGDEQMPTWFYQVLGDDFGPLSTRERIAAFVDETIKSDTRSQLLQLTEC